MFSPLAVFAIKHQSNVNDQQKCLQSDKYFFINHCLKPFKTEFSSASKFQNIDTKTALATGSPCGWGDLSVRLGSRISPHRHRVVVEVHWRGAQGWRSISWVVATFNHVGGSFNLSMAATGDVWIIPSFQIWGYVLHVEHISCVITNCGQLQWAIPSLFSIAL